MLKLSVVIKSYSYYDVATLTASATNYTPDQKKIPIDSDNDSIADSWEQTYGIISLPTSTDNESVSGITQTGDGFTILNEYKGYTIAGAGHYRMNPSQKEIFFQSNSTATGANFAKSGLESLGLTVIAPTSNNPMTFLGSQSRMRIFANKSTYNSTSNDGDWYYANGNSKGDTGVTFGQSWFNGYYIDPPGPETGEVAAIYETAIYNFFNLNKVNETASRYFELNFATSSGMTQYRSTFNGNDLNGDGDNFDAINVFDLMSPVGQPNAPIDNSIAGCNESQVVNRSARHEVAHPISLDDVTSGSSVMRNFIGPAFIDTFTSLDKQKVKLKS